MTRWVLYAAVGAFVGAILGWLTHPDAGPHIHATTGQLVSVTVYGVTDDIRWELICFVDGTIPLPQPEPEWRTVGTVHDCLEGLPPHCHLGGDNGRCARTVDFALAGGMVGWPALPAPEGR